MSIGLCCQYILPIIKKSGKIEYINQTHEQTLRFGKYQENKYSQIEIEQLWYENIDNLFKVIQNIKEIEYKSFRISSNLFPLHDKEQDLLHSSNRIINKLKEIGNYIKINNIRLTCHPDQFVVLSSINPLVIKNSINILNHHTWIFDTMELDNTPFYSINIHGGRKNGIDDLIKTIKTLPENTKSRLTLENDELCYNINQLVSVNELTSVPVVLDSHHYSFNPGDCQTLEAAVTQAGATWRDIKPLQHLSNTEPGMESGSFRDRRKHSDYIHYIPDIQKSLLNSNQMDIDFEVKMKNIAIEKAIKELDLKI